MTEMPYLCWAFLYTSTGVNSYRTTTACRKEYTMPWYNRNKYKNISTTYMIYSQKPVIHLLMKMRRILTGFS
ncbi:hypothetical protein CV945_15615 [Geobacillus sp. Manikaran-105]|nr:hypothetical protein CV945_15615 [Geobacillus sp. Manikaran-105]